VTITVTAATAGGNAKITAIPNTCPVIVDLRATPVPLKLNTSVSLQISATDADGDNLSYAWTAPDCTGSFSSTSVASPTFTLTAVPASLNCTFLVDVSDGTFADGKAKCTVGNHLSMPVTGPNDVVVGAPVFGYDYQTQDLIKGGDVVKFEIVAPTCATGTPVLSWTTVPAGLLLSDIATLDAPFTIGKSFTADTGAEDSLDSIVVFRGRDLRHRRERCDDQARFPAAGGCQQRLRVARGRGELRLHRDQAPFESLRAGCQVHQPRLHRDHVEHLRNPDGRRLPRGHLPHGRRSMLR